MKGISWLISKYLVGAILPYFAFAWLLLSVILFVQQASRFSDIFFSVNIPANLIWQLTLALIPNVIAFTCPMAMLVGTIIGLSKMQGDSELIAIRAAGVGNLQITVPILILGILLSVFAFVVNLKGVPIAAALVRSVALQTAIKKLESPIEPGVFNTEVAGYTIYVKGGDIESGRWNNIFIYNEDTANNSTRLITSRNGRIDVTNELSELVLENATVSTIPNEPGVGKYVAESIGEVRLAIKTRRGELIDKLSNSSGTPEELGLSQLSDYANSKDGKDRTEAQILWQRRITLSITPLIFCLLGTAMILRFSRGGRGFGIFLALVGLVGYYLLAFAGEQLARTGKISVLAGGSIPIIGSLIAIAWFSLSRNKNLLSRLSERVSSATETITSRSGRLQSRGFITRFTTGLRDLDLLLDLIKYFLLTFGFLTAVFLIFTAFELWKFAGVIDGGLLLLIKYLFFLLPFIYLQIAPSAAMVGILATYVIKSRQNEIVTWTSAGQSVYRLLVPAFVVMALLGLLNWQVQERLTPQANQRQDEIRTQIRKGGIATPTSGRYWIATERRIYSFEMDSAEGERLTADRGIDREPLFNKNLHTLSEIEIERRALHTSASDNESGVALSSFQRFSYPVIGGEGATPMVSSAEEEAGRVSIAPVADAGIPHNHHSTNSSRNINGSASNLFLLTAPNIFSMMSASDNEKTSGSCLNGCVKNLTIYEFSIDGSRMQTLYRSPRGQWEKGKVILSGRVEKNDTSDGTISTQTLIGSEVDEVVNPFAGIRGKPSHLNISELRSRLDQTDSDVEKSSFSVAIQKRYSTFVLPLIIALFTAPFALSLSRKGKVVTVGYAIGLWLLFMGVTNTFAQFGESGSLSAPIAVWSPLLIFSMLGVFLLSKLKT